MNITSIENNEPTTEKPEYTLEELLEQSSPESLTLSDEDKAWLNESM